jgi:hypothetical protein
MGSEALWFARLPRSCSNLLPEGYLRGYLTSTPASTKRVRVLFDGRAGDLAGTVVVKPINPGQF